MNKLPDKIGVIAGRGMLPFIFCKAARAAGVKQISVIAMHDETNPEIAEFADTVDWVYVGQIKKAAAILKKHDVSHAVLHGQVKPEKLFKGIRPDLMALKILLTTKERNADTLFGALCDAFSSLGIEIIDSTTCLDASLSTPGVMGKIKPSKAQTSDIEFGKKIAREVSRLDIGQTVVVKKGTVLAVEGFEGTDKAIKRGGQLGHGKSTVVKVAKPNHDMRFDVPCIGMRTVNSLIEGKIQTLAVQVGKAIFVEKDKVIKALNKAKICVVGIECDW